MRLKTNNFAATSCRASNSMTRSSSAQRFYAFSSLIVLAVVSIELIRTAWLSDDSFITIRTVLNFIHHYGPTFNIDERVQAYTHPLWFMLISIFSFIFKNVYWVVFSLSIGCSLVVFVLMMYFVAIDISMGILGVSLLGLSKAFIDFSTSGLENPLSHVFVLLIVLTTRALEKQLFLFFLLCSGLYLTRPDLILLFLPWFFYALFLERYSIKRFCTQFFYAVLPVLAWEAFAVYYYGYFFPNSAYAKLSSGVPHLALLRQALFYFLESFAHDPLTLTSIVLANLIAWSSNANAPKIAVMGIQLYLIYILWIGGDFMSGRFLAAPLLIAISVLVQMKLSTKDKLIYLIFMGILGSYSIHATLFSNSAYENKMFYRGIADERGYWYQTNGLLGKNKRSFTNPDWSVKKRKVAVVYAGLGESGLRLGPSTHLIDLCGLSDPLLARLPMQSNPNWRIGHFARALPPHYIEGLFLQKNLLLNSSLKLLYQHIWLLTRARLNDPKRLKELLI